MSVTLAQTRIRPDDNGYNVVMIGINYPAGKVVVRIRFDSGDEQDITFEGARLTTLRTSVAQFSGLRLAVEQFLTATEPNLGGVAS
jgi:hypothetical protein